MDATALAERLRDGRFSARTIAERCLARIAEREPLVAAWAWIDADQALAEADRLDTIAPDVRGPLHGLPIGVKDVILTRDMPTRYNCALYRDAAPSLDAAVVRVLRAAGAMILGKTATVELASIGNPPPTRNPHAPDRTPGGSSSGSAAAVADGHVPIAIGTQTGGSIIRPASFCGAWALKPTFGLVSTEGVKPFAPSLDTVGWFARSARDLALPLALFDPGPPVPAPLLKGVRIGIWRTPAWRQTSAETGATFAGAIAMLERAGAILIPLAMPPLFDSAIDTHRCIMLAEGGTSFAQDFREGADRLGGGIAQMVRDRQTLSPDTLRAAYRYADQCRSTFDGIAATVDAILAPSTVGPAPLGLAETGDPIFNGLFTMLHGPCINIPCFTAANALPIGLTLANRRFDDRVLVALATAIDASVSPDQ